MMIFWIVIGVAVLWFVSVFNGFMRLKNRVEEAWADIDVQLKRRYDLIPNLLETVKGYATHESSVLESVTNARNMAIGAGAMGTLAGRDKAENDLSGTLKSLFAVSENYPDLKANTNFLELQRELSDTENKIQASRRFYNSVVVGFNTKLAVFPSNIIGKIFGFAKKELFGLDGAKEEREVVKIKF